MLNENTHQPAEPPAPATTCNNVDTFSTPYTGQLTNYLNVPFSYECESLGFHSAAPPLSPPCIRLPSLNPYTETSSPKAQETQQHF